MQKGQIPLCFCPDVVENLALISVLFCGHQIVAELADSFASLSKAQVPHFRILTETCGIVADVSHHYAKNTGIEFDIKKNQPCPP